MHILFILKILFSLQYWKYTNLLLEICPNRHFFDKWCFSKPISSINFLFRSNVFMFFESPNSPLSKTGPIFLLGLIIIKIFDFDNTPKIYKNTPKMHKNLKENMSRIALVRPKKTKTEFRPYWLTKRLLKVILGNLI